MVESGIRNNVSHGMIPLCFFHYFKSTEYLEVFSIFIAKDHLFSKNTTQCVNPVSRFRTSENIGRKNRQGKNIPNYILSVFITVFLVLSCLVSAAYADSVSGKKKQLNITRDRLRAVRKHINIVNRRERDLSHQLNRAQKQISRLRTDIKHLNVNIKQSKKEIAMLKQDLGGLQGRHESRQELLQKRLRDIYLNDDQNILNLVAGAQDMNDFLSRSEYLSRIVESDEQLIKSIRIEQQAIRFKQNQITDKYSRMLSYRGKLKQKRSSLETIKSKRKALLDAVEEKRKAYLLKKYALEDHTHELEMDIQQKIREFQREEAYARRQRSYSAGSSSGGGRSYAVRRGTGSMSWPVSGPVTSGFGWRIHPIFGTQKFHTGIDMGVGYGTSIRATDSGNVILAGWCGGYGNAVIIDHGNGISTLYAHCSRLYVSYGQAVSKGQSVAAVGSTGYSTGPHLHFEVRVSGVPVNPWGYLR